MKIVFLHAQTSQQMTGFIIKTDNGKIIAFDGGARGDTENLINVVRELSGSENGAIDFWFMTHPHDDHYGPFVEMSEKNVGTSVNAFCYYPLPDSIGEYEKYFANQIVEFNKAVSLKRYPVISLKEGNSFTVGNVTLDILMVPDVIITANCFNNASVIIKITEKRENKPDFVFTVLGDLGVEGSDRLLSKYSPDMLKSDMVQMAHHGQNGATKELYTAISPKYAFFPTPDWLWTNTANPAEPGKGPWKTLEVRKWMEELGAETIRTTGENIVFDT